MFSGKKALVTGASKGVGATVAEMLASQGMYVCLVARSEDALAETARRCKDSGAAGVSVHPVDLSNPADVDRLAEELLSTHGCIHALVNCAALYPDPGKLDPVDGNPDAWEAALQLNVLAPMRLTRRLAPAMAKEGSGYIINLGSVAGRRGVADEASYAATKWAMHGWSTSCYEALKDQGIKVMVVEPAHVATDMAAVQGGTRYREMKPELMITAEDVAQAVLLPFQVSPCANVAEVVLNKMQKPYVE